MRSLLHTVTLDCRPSFVISTASSVGVLGRAHYSSTTEPEWTPTRQYASKSSEIQAQRYATDPKFRAQTQAYMRARYQKNKEEMKARYEENKEERLVYMRKYLKKHPEKAQTTWHRYRSTPNFDQRYNAPRRARYASDHHLRQMSGLRQWVRNNPDWVPGLSWPTHRPIWSDKALHYCIGCKHTRPLKLWWQDKKTDEFMCHPCFTSDWSRALPLDYEDKVFGSKRRTPSRSANESKYDP
ncbi:unnamed protein product [Aureobasidium uvarum]|uniref:Uncharacterized protein n=1 Tax=Aureobasidium uvarum TaxID=2773716 RepID=A0A9N8KE67_9PEZI|nr:unnamed protein product [Aureobasidium uvarum]